jgi:hypothetical protein
MTKATHFAATVPLLVLAEGVPPGSRFKKMCLSQVDCEISLNVVPRSDTSVAFTIAAANKGPNAGRYERHGEVTHDRQNIVSHDEKLYLDVALSAKELVKRMRDDVLFRPGRSSEFKEDFQRAILARSPRMVWPDNLHATTKTYSLHVAKDLVKNAIGAKYTDDGLQQIEDAKRRFRHSLADILVIDGACHVGCGEPLYEYQPAHPRRPGDQMEVRVWDSAFWPGGGGRGGHMEARTRVFLASQEDAMKEEIGRAVATKTIGIVDGDAIRFPLEEMEYFRIAGRLVRDIAFRLGKYDVVLTVDRQTLDAFAALRDLVQSCDPVLDGVPPSIEEKFEALVSCLPRIPTVPHEVDVTQADIDYARGMWENRPILTSVAPKPRKFG